MRISTFNGDYEGLEEMAREAWRNEYGIDSYPNLYKPSYLKYLLSIAADDRFTITAYDGDKIVGFLMTLPRTMALDGVSCRAGLTCLLVISKHYARTGLARKMIQEGLERNREMGLDFTLFYLETGHRSSKLFSKMKSKGAPIDRVKNMHVVARVLDYSMIVASEKLSGFEKIGIKIFGVHGIPSGDYDPSVMDADSSHVLQIQELLNSHARKTRLSRVFTKREIERELIAVSWFSGKWSTPAFS